MNAMEGAALRRTRQIDLGISTAWHTAMFALAGYSGGLKGKQLSDFLVGTKSDGGDLRPKHAEGIAYFHRLAARGVDVKITRH